MKKQIDIQSYVSESEQSAFLGIKKDSYVRYEHKFIDAFLSFFKEQIMNLNFSLPSAINNNLLMLSEREQYTLKKESLELIMSSIFKSKNKNFFSSNDVLKIKGDEDSFLSSFLTKKEKAYITFNIQPMEFIKLSRSSKLVDHQCGDIYTIKDQYQEPVTMDYPCSFEKLNFTLQYPMYINILIISSSK